MALKPDRIEDPFGHDINFYMDEVAERGGVVVLQSAGSGGYPGNPNAVCTYAANPSGRYPLGMLLCDVVNLDTSKYHVNWYKEQALKNGKVILARRGQFTTNMIVPGSTPVGGETAYLGASGLLTTSAGGPAVGQFRGSKDQDGYACVFIDLI